jgi:hypothetical protein
MLEREVQTERLARAQAEQGVTDRDADLLAARCEIYSVRVEMDFLAEKLRRAEQQKLSVQAELDQLRALVSRLGAAPALVEQEAVVVADDPTAASRHWALGLLSGRKASARAS